MNCHAAYRAATIVILLALPLASAQADGFLRLGEDPSGDAQIQGQSHLDTMADILFLDIMTTDDSIVFDLGMAGTTTELGSYCPVAAFQVGSTEYMAFDCFECVAYECTNEVSGASAPSSSRGTNVASSVELLESTARITVPFSAIGVDVGDSILDIYALIYQTRALNVADAAPDEKSVAGAEESFGEYVVGVGRPDAQAAVPVVLYDDVDLPLTHAFGNATSGTYVLNFTTDLSNSTANFTWSASNGTVNATLADANGTVVFESVFEGNGTLAQDLVAVPGDWNLTLVYGGFVGEFAFDLQATAAPAEVVDEGSEGNETIELDDVDKDTPLPLLAPLGGVLVALGLRRRR